MKHLVKITAVFFIGLAVVSCKKAQNKTEAKEAEEIKEVAKTAVNYKVDAENSVINWKGFKPTGTHDGTLKLSEGSVSVENGAVTGGNFMIDMNSIVVLDIKDEKSNADLVGHLKGEDFFDTAKNGFGAFAITSVEAKDGKTMVKGNLTLKGVKKNIEFPATVAMDGDAMTISTVPFSINRTDWGIKYKSKTFFDDLKEKFINDEIEISFTVKATKA